MRNQFASRKYVLGGLVIFVALAFLVKLVAIQLINPKYKLSADNNSRHRQIEYPARGLLLDRYGEVMVFNQAAYDVLIIPNQIQPFDTTELCSMLDLTIEELEAGIVSAREFSSRRPSVLVSQLSALDYAIFQEKLFKYPGFYVQGRAQRAYKNAIAPHVIGHLGEVDVQDLRADEYYATGDYIGVSGLEKQYENVLRGKKGIRYFLVDVHNQRQGSYDGGKFDTLPEPGRNIQISLDAQLQLYGETLMNGKRGSIVAIEPGTGEILAMISSPDYDPGVLVGRERTPSFYILQKDSTDPLFNRATMSRYAPGSIFKIVQALIALEQGVINENTGFECNKDLIGCHNHPEATNVKKAIQYSCNPYFFQVYKRIIQPGRYTSIFRDSEAGIEAWREHVLSFGLGTSLLVDLPNVKGGFIPDATFYDRWYGRRRWAFSTIYSNSNGQGEVESVPIQIANLAAIIANRGFYITPHFIKAIDGDNLISEEYKQKKQTTVDAKYFDIVVDAMYDVVWEPFGTGRRARVPGITVCGKTGTVQNVHGEDHSGFFAFAPKDNPQIALVVYVENAGGGGEWAAPIASLMIEEYLTGEVLQLEKEKRILDFMLN